MIKLAYRQVGGVYNNKDISVGIFMVDETVYYLNANCIMPQFLYVKALGHGCSLWCSTDDIEDCYAAIKDIKNLTEKLYILLDIYDESRGSIVGQQRFYYSKVNDGVYQLNINYAKVNERQEGVLNSNFKLNVETKPLPTKTVF